MSNTAKSIVFLALTFALSWGAAIGAYFSRCSAASEEKMVCWGIGITGPFAGWAQTLASAGAVPILVAMMTGPAIAALICVFAFEKGRRIEALGLKFKPNLWWLWAWLIPLAIAAGSVLLTILLSGRHLVDLDDAIIAAVAPDQVEQLRAIPYLGAIQIGAAVTLGALINAPILTFTEELGWRGYLYDLWARFGFWPCSLATGAIWGLWHAPAIYFYGLNYPDQPLLGIGLFVVYCILMTPIITLIRERGGATWAAGIFHGTINAVGGLTIVVLSNPAFPWNGIVGIGGFVTLALGVVIVFLLQRRAPSPAPAAT